MAFKNELASYEPLRKILDSEKLKDFLNRVQLQSTEPFYETIKTSLVHRNDLPNNITVTPDLILAIDGSQLVCPIEKGFPGSELGSVTIAAVLMDLKLINQLEKEDIIDPKEFRKTETPATQESIFPGCNCTLDNETDSKASLRKRIFEEFSKTRPFHDGETILETYEHLLRIKIKNHPDSRMPESPLDDVDTEMVYGFGEYRDVSFGDRPLYSTDALRLHELMNPIGTNGELYGQIRDTLEKLWLINILRFIENKGFFSTLRRIAFIMDGPLAVFSTASWLAKVIEAELWRINDEQKVINGQNMIIIGIEKSGVFFNHFEEIDTSKEGIPDVFEKQTALLLDDTYIKKNIIFSKSTKPYGQDTYFGRKMFYKAAAGQRVIPVIAWFNNHQKNIITAELEQFNRLRDVMELLDKIVSNRYKDSLSPLIAAHAEAAIPLKMGTRLFENIAREIREKAENG